MGNKQKENILIKDLPQKINLVDSFFKFKYPFSMKIPSYIGQVAWQQNSLSLLDTFYLWIQKIYNNITNTKKDEYESIKNQIFNFIMQDRTEIENRMHDLIINAKEWI